MDDVSSTILDRLLQGAGLKRDSQLAEFLGVTPQAVSQARRKGRIPDGWTLKIATRFHLSTDWVFFGTGVPTVPEATHKTLAQESGVVAATDTVHTGLGPDSAIGAGSPSPHPLTRYREIAVPPIPSLDEGDDNDATSTEMAMIPLVDARLAAGQGSLETESNVLGYFGFRQDWLCRKGNPDRMVLMKVCGDSMEPDICHGDMVLVDQGHTQIYGHAIYAVGVNEEIYIKQIETLPGARLVLRSLNPRYAPIDVDLSGDLADSVRVIGRIVWWCREA